MIGNILQKILMGQYALMAIVFLIEGQYNKTLYWVGALIITIAVWRMK